MPHRRNVFKRDVIKSKNKCYRISNPIKVDVIKTFHISSVFQRNSTMEEVILRSEHLADQIFLKLNNQGLAKSKKVGKTWENFLHSSKSCNLRIIKGYTNCSNKLMNKIVSNSGSAIEIVDNLHEIFKRFPKGTRQSSPFIKNWTDSPLHLAAENGDMNSYHLIMEKIKDKNPLNPCRYYWFTSCIDHKDLYCRRTTPLHIAARKGHYEICRLILENTEMQIPTDDVGDTPFHLAAKNGHFSICQLLIENRVINFEDKNPKGCESLTVLHIAAANGHLEICKLIVEAVIIEKLDEKHPGGSNSLAGLHIAAANGNLAVCKLIIEAVEELDRKDPFSCKVSPMDLAIKYNHVHVQEYLRNLE